MKIKDLLWLVDGDQLVHLVIDSNDETIAVIDDARKLFKLDIDHYDVGIVTVNENELVVRVYEGE